MASNANAAAAGSAGKISRQKCFLCEVPRGPWAMINDFPEPVCRACCNYEGLDRIEEVIAKGRELRKAFDGQHVGHAARHSMSGVRQADILEVIPGSVAISGNFGESHVALTTPQYAVVGSNQLTPITKTASNGRVDVHSSYGKSRVAGIPVVPSTQSFKQSHNMLTESSVTTESNPQRLSLIQETLAVLSKCTPFRVRFSKDHSLFGRVFAFDAVSRGSDYELKVYIEYPIGSGTVFQSASGAGRQMYGEFRERLGIGGGFRGASSNGYKDLEFEQVLGTEKWHTLGELLSEEVRFFRGHIKSELLPTPYEDPKFPNLPVVSSFTPGRGPLKTNSFAMKKRPDSDSDESDRKRFCPSDPSKEATADDRKRICPSEPSKETTPDVKTPPANPDSSQDASHAEQASPSHNHTKSPPNMRCFLCYKMLEDTRFVQCPSVTGHKFCFSCSRDSIKKQSSASTDVYCPSGMKCLIMGSSTPWAFMESEIATILESGNS